MIDKRTFKDNHLTPVQSIRAKCMDCTNCQPLEIRLCPILKCPLFPYRMCKRPKKGSIRVSLKECIKILKNRG